MLDSRDARFSVAVISLQEGCADNDSLVREGLVLLPDHRCEVFLDFRVFATVNSAVRFSLHSQDAAVNVQSWDNIARKPWAEVCSEVGDGAQR